MYVCGVFKINPRDTMTNSMCPNCNCIDCVAYRKRYQSINTYPKRCMNHKCDEKCG